MKYLCIIPARCGSKGIPFKNIIDVSGKPLISYTIDMAMKLKEENMISKVIVSTDCEEIEKVAISHNAEVPFLRPSEISGDKAKSIDFVLHSLSYYEKLNDYYDAVIILQPTSPLRTYDDLKESIDLFTTKKSESLISVYEEETINDLIMYHKEADFAIAVNENHNKGVRRQDHGSIYIRNGAIYITSTEYLQKEEKIISDKPLLKIMEKKNSVNIDTYDDLEYVRNIL